MARNVTDERARFYDRKCDKEKGGGKIRSTMRKTSECLTLSLALCVVPEEWVRKSLHVTTQSTVAGNHDDDDDEDAYYECLNKARKPGCSGVWARVFPLHRSITRTARAAMLTEGHRHKTLCSSPSTLDTVVDCSRTAGYGSL